VYSYAEKEYSCQSKLFSQVCSTPTTKLRWSVVIGPTVLPSVLNTLPWLGLVVASSCVNRGKKGRFVCGGTAVTFLLASRAVVKTNIAADGSHTTERQNKRFGFS
jgi:hypothetical protein